MARIEDILNNWKWDEEKIRKYLEQFEKHINSKDGQDEVKNRNKIKSKAQNYLKDEESIDKLSTEELKELLRMVNTIRTYEEIKSKERPITSEIDKGNIEYIKQIKNWLKELIKIQETVPLPEGPKHFSPRAASELLTFRYPEKFYIVNGASIKGLNELRLDNIPELNESNVNENNYPNWRPLFEYLKDKISKVIKDKLNKETDYYDVDLFLYFISEQIKKSKEKKTEESEAKNKESSIITETDKKIEFGEEKIGSIMEKPLSLQEYFQYQGFYFDQDLITAFYSALKTKGFVILSGLTGTGKTKLAQLFAELLCPNCFKKQSKEENTQNPQDEENTQVAQNGSENLNQSKCTHLFLPVRPDWRDSKALLGYYNPITRNYESTNLLNFILEAIGDYNSKENKADPFFIILDEMNLSHVEYYFADFLSVLESGRDENYWTKETIKLHNIDKKESESIDKKEDTDKKEKTIPIPKEIKLPPNLYIIGSVNIDETTYMFSPKVLDRAFTIEFRDVNFDDYLKSLQTRQNNISKDELRKLLEPLRDDLLNDLRNNGKFCAAVADKKEIKSAINELDSEVKAELNQLNQILQPYDLHFGYRVLDEIALFIKYATNAPDKVGKLSPEHALDFAVLMKVLPKFHGPRQKLERPLWLVLGWCLKNSVKYENKTFDNLINEIWGILTDQKKRPNIEDLTNVIQKLKLELNNRSKNESQEANSGSQPIAENQNQAKEEKTPIIDKVKYPRTAIKVLTMLRQLYETGFTSFA